LCKVVTLLKNEILRVCEWWYGIEDKYRKEIGGGRKFCTRIK
jgi:hypothetical protein